MLTNTELLRNLCEESEALFQNQRLASRYRTRSIVALVVMLIVPLWSSGAGSMAAGAAPYLTAITQVAATVETDPVPSGNDTADDIAVWIHPSDRAKSRIIGVDKAFGEGKGGLLVYDLAGNQLQYLNVGSLNNVDVRYNFSMGGQLADLIVASNQNYQTISIFRIRDGFVEHVSKEEFGIPTGMFVYGSCMYHSPVTGEHYVFISQNPYMSTPTGKIQQWKLVYDTPSGKVDADLVRSFDVGSEAEACVADDVTGDLYIAETRVGIWKYGAEPGGGTTRTQVDSISSIHFGGEKELEGLTLYYAGSRGGYLMVAGQFTSTYFVYRRDGNNEYVTSFQIGPGNGIDEVTGTDGIDVTNVPMGDRFPQGAFIAHDQANTDPSANSNYKLVPWQSIANGAGLTIDTSYSPRSGSAPAPSPVLTSLSFPATADARVEEAAPDTNYGGDIELRARGGSTDPHIRSYLRFTVSGVTRKVQRAKLRLHAASNTSNGPALYTTSNSWAESTITWRQAPARSGGAIDDKGVIASGTWVEYDVSSIVKGDGTYNFMLMTDISDGLKVSSREGANPPQLVLTLDSKRVFLPVVLKTN